MKIKLGFQSKILLLLILVFTTMLVGVVTITYQIIHTSIINRYYDNGSFICESVARNINVDEFISIANQKNFFTQDETHSYFIELRKTLNRLKETNSAKHLYTATLDNETHKLLYVVDGNPRYDTNFIKAGTAVESVRGVHDQIEAVNAFKHGKPITSANYKTDKSGELVSIYYPIFDMTNKTIGIVVFDYDYSLIKQSVFKDLLKIITTIALFALFTIFSIFIFIKMNLIKGITILKQHMEHISSGNLSQNLDQKLLERTDEIGSIFIALAKMQNSFRSIVASIISETEKLNSEADKVFKQSELVGTSLTKFHDSVKQFTV